MQVYLLKDLPGKGRAGDVINVNDGYGKNFIIKNKIGVIADAAVLSQIKSKKESAAFHAEEEKAAIRETIKKLEKVTVKLRVKTGAGGKMFGSVSTTELNRELEALGFQIEKRQIQLEPIKAVGSYKIKVKFNYSLEGEFKLEVESE